jgi:hypothetical protein
VPAQESEFVPLPEDRELLAAMVRTLLADRNHEKQRAEAQAQRAEELQVELLRLQLELERFKKWYYGPRADRLQSTEELSQLLLNCKRPKFLSITHNSGWEVSSCCGDRFGLKPATYRMKREWAKLRYAKAAEVAPQRMD